MMRLHNLKPNPGAKKRRKRIGFGESSGKGKTSGRGHKGAKARAGTGIRSTFEGGQMPLFRRLPKRGFNNAAHKTVYLPVNLEDLNVFEDGATVDAEAIRAAGLANGRAHGIKVLGNGKLQKKLTVALHAFSASAREQIEKLGGTCEVVAAPAKLRSTPKAKASE